MTQQTNKSRTDKSRLLEETSTTKEFDDSSAQFQPHVLVEILAQLSERIADIDRKLDELGESIRKPKTPREYYTVAEFAELTQRSQYRVREWCRLERINAEKCETGRGDAKSWRIPANELSRYQDHGLLPAKYLR